jgi:predicted AAA+ superfamily ATPase
VLKKTVKEDEETREEAEKGTKDTGSLGKRRKERWVRGGLHLRRERGNPRSQISTTINLFFANFFAKC